MKRSEKIRLLIQDIITGMASIAPEINEGGCGRFAEILSEELHRHGVRHRIALFRSMTSTNNVRAKKRYIKEILAGNYLHAGETSVGHVMLKIGGLLVDGTSCVNINEYYEYHVEPIGYYTLTEMKIANVYGDWLDRYDREKDKLVKKLVAEKAKLYLT